MIFQKNVSDLALESMSKSETDKHSLKYLQGKENLTYGR